MTQLSEFQEQQAWSIAQYDVQAAYRYCAVVAAKSARKCPVCGSELRKAGYNGLFCPDYKNHGELNRFVFNAIVEAIR